MISSKFKPFAPELIPIILKSDLDNVLRLKSRENSRIEFKQAFNFSHRDDYAKTMAAFANASGGYLIFGVTNSPRLVCGLANQHFEEFDPEKLTAFLNSVLSPELEWEAQTVTFHGKVLGMFYTWEATRKPVVCIKNSGPLKEADLYYRYRGRSERIKYPELSNLLEAEREKERQLWRRHLESISRIGVSNAAVLDTKTGLVSGTGGSFLISEDLLPKLKFVREGMFTENAGSPSLKLVGELRSVSGDLITPTEIVFRNQALHPPDVILGFLRQRQVENPIDYLTTACYSPSAYLPIRFFINQAGLSTGRAIKVIERIPSRQPTRSKLIERLKHGDKFTGGSLAAGTQSATIRKRYLESLRKGVISDEIPAADLWDFLHAVFHMKREDIEVSQIFTVMLGLFETHYATTERRVVDVFRRAICHLDCKRTVRTV